MKIALSFAIAISILILITVLNEALELPVVVYSVRAQECEYVLEKGVKSAQYDCENTPNKYSTMWIE
jgi:hypothetical protein